MTNQKNKKAIIYRRVSTSEQNRSGLGLDAQLESCERFCADNGYAVVADFREAQSGKGSDKDRPVLAEALAQAKAQGCVLVVSKLCRLSRSVFFVSKLVQEGVSFIVVEMPEADAFQLHLFASFAQMEREQISKRVKAALKQAKKRGVVLGSPCIEKAQAVSAKKRVANADAFAEKVAPAVIALRDAGMTLQGIATHLNETGVATRRGGAWHACTVRNLLNRAA